MQEDTFILYGSEYSPFSVKVRSYLRYKGIPHVWRPRTRDNMAEFQAHAKLPLIPLLLRPDGTAMQDSTPMIEKLEAEFPSPSILPDEAVSVFMSALIEEYADEWGNKPMFHYRWWRDEDQIAISGALAAASNPSGSEAENKAFAQSLRERMVPRLSFVGSSEQNRETIEQSLEDLLGLLEVHLKGRPYLFGGRPALADFGLFGQLYGCTQQPTTIAILKDYPLVSAWIDRMVDPAAEGAFEPWADLAGTLVPLIRDQVGGLYMPWAVANSQALMQEAPTFTVSLRGCDFTQDTMKYTGRSFMALRKRYQDAGDNGLLEEALIKADCLKPLVSEYW
ncbi:glutathione S-transferase family protein [Sneathiella chinensis]|uniref:Glutathione S-transferase n=1 Tax=Sneathiella chinensis TaxID=349750 RepID=A0ABQ5U3R9_9PROT|nr:glutathione S-transferase family protein [Sneathiella chinensis]GLQ06727.1 glutathione S-transferase [Sneathiella chinensis]